MTSSANNKVICDFCDHSFPLPQENKKAGHYVIKGKRTNICDRCIEDCWKIVQEEKKKC